MAPTTTWLRELMCKEPHGRLEPPVLWLLDLFRISGCYSQLSLGWLMLAPPFPLASVPLTSGFGWVHLAQSETAVRDAHFAVETPKLSWSSSGMEWGKDLAQAPGRSHQSAQLSLIGKEARVTPVLHSSKLDRSDVVSRPCVRCGGHRINQ